MIISFIVAIPLIALSVWFYLKLYPSGTTLKSRLGFETSVLAEEMPDAYKDISQVVNVVHGAGISRKVAKLRPIAVVKG